MAEVTTRWWGVIVDLTKEEACFVTAPRTELGAVLSLIGPPIGAIVVGGIQSAKSQIRQAIGEGGISLSLTWAGIPIGIVGSGNSSPCQVTGPSPATLSSSSPPISLVPLQFEFFSTPMPAGADLQGTIDISGYIFRDIQHSCLESTQQDVFSIEFTNNSGRWIEVVVERPDGSEDKSGPIQHGEQGMINNYISLFKGGRNKIVRWRPSGFLNVPGSGGGDLFFTVPDGAGSGYLRFVIVG